MRYQDFVIKDGNFVGKFEEMYQQFEDPWNQSEEGYFNDISRQIVISYIKKYKINDCVEFGCGLGKTLNFIQKETCISMLGIDISKTSIKKAKKAFPHLNFKVDNIKNILNYESFNCFFFSEITWYLLEERILEEIFEIMTKNFKNKYLIHNLVFYKGQQEYGINYFKNFEEFINFCPFKLLSKAEINHIEKDTINTSCIFQI